MSDGCDCAEKMDAELEPSNTTLCHVSLINHKTGAVRHSLVIATERLRSTPKRTKVRTVLPTFCPFCGERYEPGRVRP